MCKRGTVQLHHCDPLAFAQQPFERLRFALYAMDRLRLLAVPGDRRPLWFFFKNRGADMLLMTGTHPQWRRQSRPRRRRAAVGAQRRALTDDGAEGTPPPTLKEPCSLFSAGSRRETSRLLYSNLPDSFSLSYLISLWFPQSYRTVTLQQPFWGDVSPSSRCASSALFCSHRHSSRRRP